MHLIMHVHTYYYHKCCTHADPMFDVMQTITEPSTDDSYPTSPMPGSDDGHDHTVKRPSGQDGMTGHFKKRKPMKPTSRTSINNIVDNKMEYDTEFDRQVNSISV